jgi:hypothetical protein
MAIDRKAISLALADDIATQTLSGIAIMAVGTGEVELAASLLIQDLAGCKERLGRAIDAYVDGQATGLKGDKGGERQEGV